MNAATSELFVIVQPRIVLADPHACTDQSDALNVLRAIFDTLIRRGLDGEWLPAVARQWQVSPDARTFTFDLREDLVFHDGTALDAAAVKFSLERMARSDMGATLGAGGVYAQYMAGLKIDSVSTWRLVVTLATPLADFFDLLAYGHLVSPTAIAKAGNHIKSRLVGSGPFRVRYIDDNVAIEAEAVPHPLVDNQRPQTIRWQAEADPAQRAVLLAQSQAHISTRLSAADLSRSSRRSDLALIEGLDPMAVVFLFNCSRGPLTDQRVRLALNLAIDRALLVAEVLGGQGQPLHGFVSSAHFGAPAAAVAAQGLPYDPQQARRLLDEAGFRHGLSLGVDRPDRLPDEAAALTDAVARQLEKIGVTFNVRVEADRERYAHRVRLKDIHDLALFDSSPLSTFRVLVEKIDSRFRGSWWQGYSNAKVEALLDAARCTVDNAQRRAIYRAAYVCLQGDPPWLYLYTHRRLTGMTATGAGWTVAQDDVLDIRRST